MSIFRGPKDTRIRFSKSWTLFNFFISTFQILGCGLLFYEHVFIIHNYVSTEAINFIFTHIDWLKPNFKTVSFKYIYGVMLVLHASVAVLTTLFILWDYLMCCCCTCWLGAAKWHVYDPEHPEASLVWREGKVVNLEREQSREKALSRGTTEV